MANCKYWKKQVKLIGITALYLCAFTIFFSPGITAAGQGLKAVMASPNSVALTWTAPGDDSITGTAAQYDIRYSTSSITDGNWDLATQATGEPTPKSAGGTETFTVIGLQPNTTYYFAIKAADEVSNWSGLSNVVNKSTTSETTPPAVITNLTTGTATATSVVLTWTAPGDDSITGTAAQYDIRYSTSLITELNWSSASQITGEPIPKSVGNAETFTVTGLQNGTLYYFAIKTADEVPNWSGLSNVVNKSTTDQIPPARIGDLAAVEGADSGEIFLSWSATGDDGTSGTATSYTLKYSTDSITDANWNSANVYTSVPSPPLSTGLTENMTMSGLGPGQLYYVALKARDDALNESELSNVASSTAAMPLSADDQIILLSPVSGVCIHSSHPTLAVKNVNASSQNIYYFQIAADSHFISVTTSPAINQQGGVSTVWRIPIRLTDNKVYYWRASANELPYSEVFHFTVQPSVHPYPNPFDRTKGSHATFTDIPANGSLILTSVSGTTIRQWNNLSGQDIKWDGTNEDGYPVAPGTYLWFIKGSDSKGKLVVVK
ncbi:MAG: fibronectin type III domain-containing protein [candidate division Zixibacteria bacterium]|nr:fibronectin type III domain-containing protein [candidate division Zixibacteria bacterium]